MNCNCGFPARYLISRDGKPCYTCGLGRCRFYALTPVQCDGYNRVTLGAPGCPPADTGVVLRFEALVHPDQAEVPCFMVRVQGEAPRWSELRMSVLQDPQFDGAWYTTAKAFLYPMAQYGRLVAAVKSNATANIALEEVPSFYFRCVERMRQVPIQYTEDAAHGRARLPDEEDCVYRQLKPFQKEGVKFVLQHQGRAMIADDMGLGKTVQAIAVAHHYREEWPVLVVCPMSLLENWAKEFNKFCGIPYTRIAILQGTKATATSLQDVVIVSYSSLKCVEQAHFNVIILDESHYIKAGAAKRAQLSLKLCRESRRVLLLSGTPAMSRPMELYAQLQAIQPTMVPSKAHFGARYCNSFVSRFGIDLTGHSHTDELHSLLRHYVIRRTKKQLGNELPSKSRQLLYVYVTEKEKKALERQVGALRRSLASSTSGTASLLMSANSTGSFGGIGGGGGGGTSGDLSARAPNAFEMKMATARAKIPAVQDYVSTIVEQHLDSGEKLILFAHHQCMMEALKEAVEAVRPRQPIDYIYISGDTPAAQREPAAEHFRSEPTCTVAILSMQSSGTGHNFTCASTVVFTELDWNPSTHLQCEDRVHRIGQAQACHIKYLLAEGTSDSVIWPLLQTKLTVTTAMFESASNGAEVHLYDGANKQNVARRDVTVALTSSTPSSSQQSTLDRFLPPQPSPMTPGKRDEAGATAVPAGTPSVYGSQRSSMQSLSQQQQQLQRTSGSTPPDTAGEGQETPALLLTPTSPLQHLHQTQQQTPTPTPASLMGSPLSALRRSSTAVSANTYAGLPKSQDKSTETAAPTGPSVVVPFSEMGSAFADPLPRPHKHGGASSSSLPSSAAPAAAAATTPVSTRRSKGMESSNGSSTEEVPNKSLHSRSGTACATSSTSVLDLMRQTAVKPAWLSPSTATAASPQAPVVVDLTDSTHIAPSKAPVVHVGEPPPQPSHATPSSFHSPTPVSVIFSPSLLSVATATAAAHNAVPATTAPRRTIFTFGPPKSVTSESRSSSSPAPSTAATAAKATSAAAPAAAAPARCVQSTASFSSPSPPPASTPTVPGFNADTRVSPAVPVHASSSSSPTPTSTGAVHVPLRSNLRFKRPRPDADVVSLRVSTMPSPVDSNAPLHGERSSASAASAYSNGSCLDVVVLNDAQSGRVTTASEIPPPPSPTPSTASLHVRGATTTTATAPPSPHCSAPAVYTPSPFVPSVASLSPGGATSATAPRRTLFKLVNHNTAPAPPSPKS